MIFLRKELKDRVYIYISVFSHACYSKLFVLRKMFLSQGEAQEANQLHKRMILGTIFNTTPFLPGTKYSTELLETLGGTILLY